MFLATMDTENFRWTALGASRAEALEALRHGWDAHRRDYGHRDVLPWSEALDHYAPWVLELPVGGALRDDSLIFSPAGTARR
jgi:hypothetical protein